MDKNIIEKLSPEKILQFVLDKGINGAGSFKLKVLSALLMKP